jgi:phage terminase large subunit GpA-like protein
MNFGILQGFFDGLKPIPVTLVSDWADNNRYLSTESAAEPGKWRTSRTPYLKEILDCLSPNSPVCEIVVMKGVQLGFTEAGLNVLGCYADIAPCPMMYVMPTIDMAKDLSESRVDTMISASPVLMQKIRPARERDAGNTKFLKKFPGGSIKLSGANSAASLRSKAVRVLVLDEVDAYPLDVDGEGSPISLARNRQSTFGQKKKFYALSTPTMQYSSVIEPLYLDTDQRKYFVPCPVCGFRQVLEFTQLRWDFTKHDQVYYECIDCGHHIEERHKTKMMQPNLEEPDKGAEWIPTNPVKASPLKRGYWISTLYSPLGWKSWIDIAKEYDDSENDVPRRKSFVNNILAETWKDQGEVPPWENLYNRREHYKRNTVNNDIYFITVGVDVQKDRLELHVVGWCKNKISYSIDYRQIIGDTFGTQVWDELANVVNETWERTDKLILPMRLMAVDTGYNTNSVYNFCRRFSETRVIPIKGRDNLGVVIAAPKQVDTTSAGKKIGKIKIWNVGVSVIKSELYGWLKLEKRDGIAPPGYIHFPEYDESFFRGITAEQLIPMPDKNGHTKYTWVKKYPANEPLDTTVYARAAAAVCGLDRMKDYNFDALLQGLGRRVEVEQARSRPRSSFWGGASLL